MQPEQHRTTLDINLTFASGSRRAVVFGLCISAVFLGGEKRALSM